MSTPASIHGHPLHPMLVAFPIGLWVFSFFCDLAHRVTDEPTWSLLALYTLAAGLIGALAAAVPGFIDYLALRKRAAMRVAAVHMGLNLALVVLAAINLALRWNAGTTLLPFLLSIGMMVLLGVSGWLGGHLVHVHAVTTDPEAMASGRAVAREAGVTDPLPPAS